MRLAEAGLAEWLAAAEFGTVGYRTGLTGLLHELKGCWVTCCRDLLVAGLLLEELLECCTSCWIDLPAAGLLEEL